MSVILFVCLSPGSLSDDDDSDSSGTDSGSDDTGTESMSTQESESWSTPGTPRSVKNTVFDSETDDGEQFKTIPFRLCFGGQ